MTDRRSFFDRADPVALEALGWPGRHEFCPGEREAAASDHRWADEMVHGYAREAAERSTERPGLSWLVGLALAAVAGVLVAVVVGWLS